MKRWNPIETPKLTIIEVTDEEWKQTVEQIAKAMYVLLSQPHSTGLESPRENHPKQTEEVSA